MAWQKVNRGSFWIPGQVGESIEGKVAAFGEIDTQYGKLPVLDIETKTGVMGVSLSAGLIGQVNGFEAGDPIRIEYQGIKKNEKTKRSFKAFDVYRQAAESQVPF